MPMLLLFDHIIVKFSIIINVIGSGKNGENTKLHARLKKELKTFENSETHVVLSSYFDGYILTMQKFLFVIYL